MKKTNIFNYFSFFSFNIIILIVSYSQTYNLSVINTLLYFSLLFLLIFSYGVLNNKDNIYKKNISCYLFTYFCFLICFTMFLKRTGIGLINKEYFDYYINSINFIPFKTIFEYLKNISDLNAFVYNVIGNLIALVPLSFLCILKNDKYKSLNRQFILLSGITIAIEIFQIIFCTGRFDIDDFILNVGGALLFLTLIKKFKVINKIQFIFYNDFKIKYKLKLIIYIFIYSVVLLFSVVLLSEFFAHNDSKNELINEKIYILENAQCDDKINKTFDNYSITFECVEVFYENSDGIQMNFIDALTNKFISINNLDRILLDNDYFYDEKYNRYVSTSKNYYVYVCDNIVIFSTNKKNDANSICR